MGLIDIIYTQMNYIDDHKGAKRDILGHKSSPSTENWYKTPCVYKESHVNIIWDISYKQLWIVNIGK